MALLGRCLGQPGARALMLLISLVTLYTLYGYLYFYRDPLSIFFSEEHGYDRFYSAHRLAEADAFMEEAAVQPDALKADGPVASNNAEICATFITVGRSSDKQYIETSVGSSLVNMSLAERRAVHLKVFFADVPKPDQHPSYFTLLNSGLVDEVYSYESAFPNKTRDREIAGLVDLVDSSHNIWNAQRAKHQQERKILHDYAFALSHCYETTNASYVALFEDDILLADGWAVRTLRFLEQIEQMMQDPRRQRPKEGQIDPGVPNDWIYLRLFNQERSTGWEGGPGFFGNKVHIIAPLVAVPLLLILLSMRHFGPARGFLRSVDGWVLFVVCGLGVPLVIWLFYASGKASLLRPHPGVHEEWFGCCSQALVFNRAHTKALSDYLMRGWRNSWGGRGDMLTKDFAWDHGLARISGYPMLAQHIGQVSATGTIDDEARRIWSMEFENFKPWKLAEEHRQMVRDMFGEDAARDMIDH